MKYKIFERGSYRYTDNVPSGIPIVGENGFRPITNLSHFHAAGYNISDLPEKDRNKPAHFNLPFAELMK